MVVIQYQKFKWQNVIDCVLGEEVNDNSTILTKFILLLQRMEATNPNIDNSELRWVENRIDRLKDGEILTKNDLLTANLYWKKWENN